MLTAVLPALAGAAIALITHQLLFLAFAVAGPAALLVSMLMERRRQRRDERTARAQLQQRSARGGHRARVAVGAEVVRPAASPTPIRRRCGGR